MLLRIGVGLSLLAVVTLTAGCRTAREPERVELAAESFAWVIERAEDRLLEARSSLAQDPDADLAARVDEELWRARDLRAALSQTVEASSPDGLRALVDPTLEIAAAADGLWAVVAARD